MEDVGKKKPYTVRDTSIVQKDKDVKAVEEEKDVNMNLGMVEVFNKLIYYIYNILLTKSIFFYSLNI